MYLPNKKVHVLHVARPQRRGKVSPIGSFQLQSGHVAQGILGGVNDLLGFRIWLQIRFQAAQTSVEGNATNA